MRDSFIFYRSFYEAMKELEPTLKAQLLDVIMEYALNGNEIECEGTVKGMYVLIKPQIDANNRKRENGKLGGRPKESAEERNARYSKAVEEYKQNRSKTKT